MIVYTTLKIGVQIMYNSIIENVENLSLSEVHWHCCQLKTLNIDLSSPCPHLMLLLYDVVKCSIIPVERNMNLR